MKKIVWVSTIPLSLKAFCLDHFDELRNCYDLLAVSSPGEDLDVVANRGTRVESVKMERRISIISDIRSLCKLVVLFRRERPDLVHSITPKAGLLSMLAAKIARVPIRIHSFTGLLFPIAIGLKKKVLIATDRLTCKCATHVLSEGMGVRSDLYKYKITKNHITVLRYGNLRGIDFGYYAPLPDVLEEADLYRKDCGIHDGAFTFIFVGRLVVDKGIEELIRAYRLLRRENFDIHLLIVGVEESDELSSETRMTIMDDPTIHFTNKWVDDVRPYYAASDVLVQPSYREGVPNVVLEAGAFSLPSIVTDINGSREIIKDGVNGVIVPSHESEPLYRAMKYLLTNRYLLEAMGKSARKNVEEKYNAKDICAALKAYYAETLGEG